MPLELRRLLEPNPAAELSELELGRGRHRLVIVDDFYRFPERLLEVARELYYLEGPTNGNFPGGRAAISLDTRPLLTVLAALWGAPPERFLTRYQPLLLSRIRPEHNTGLNVDQRLPHVDPGLSAMVYLNPEEECAGGTGIYRQRELGLERVPGAPTRALLELARARGHDLEQFRTPEGYRAWVDEVVFAPESAASEGYVNAGNEHWELLHLVEMKFNRLVIFDGRMPHSQFIEPGQFTSQDRLNQVVYLPDVARGLE